ncbi:MAG TPA: adenylate/guanylate cyclase domain-containing protein [candidate division WOR-3 bacterium]|uniref:Adenylate/guanylate cyclase domain-containing protein n=1 Tax=candidate division WOR-3 bacterium TaxID=2052148 RepID=A0A9C9K0S4_UNCW3|nr:adenylate/guanylate cyclase domain-containing protein [candidate division WOR-3 bacterium]
MRCKNCNAEITEPLHFCPFCGVFIEGQKELPFENLRLTFLRADLSGFTKMSEQMIAEDVMAFLNEIFGVFSKIIESYKGVIYQIIGDEIVGVFGFPRGTDFAPHMAIIAAEDMLKALMKFNKEKLLETPIGLKIGISIDNALIFSLTNTLKNALIITQGFKKSQILQKNAEDNTLLVCEDLYKATKAFFVYTEIGEFVKDALTVKGFEYKIKEE